MKLRFACDAPFRSMVDSRGEAIEQSVRAEYELNQALFGNRRNDFRRPMNGFDRDRDRDRNDRFSERDVRRSNGELIEARRELQRAEDILERARPDYAGHRPRRARRRSPRDSRDRRSPALRPRLTRHKER